MERQMLWLSKHLVIMLQKNISTFASRCKRKAEFLVLDTPVRLVGDTGLTAQTGPETGLTGDAAVSSDSAKKDDSIVSAEA